VLRQTILNKGSLAPRWLTLILTLALCASSAAIAWQRRLATWDDAYIYARTVRNVLDGRGWSFNPDRRIDACTSPLYFSLLLGGSAAMGGGDNIPRVAAALYGFTLASTASLIFLGLKRRTGWLMAFLAAAAFLHHPYVELINGVETLLLLTCCLAAVWTYADRRHVLSAFLLALAVLARGDAVLLAGLVLGHYVVFRKRIPGPGILAAFLLPIIAWMALHYSNFNTLLPETLGAKMAQGRTSEWPDGFAAGFRIIFMEGRSRQVVHANRAAAFAALAGLAIAFLRRDAAVALLGLFAAIHVGAYELLGVPGYHWYYGPEYLALWMLTAVCLSAGARVAAGRAWHRTEGALAVIGWAGMTALLFYCCDLRNRYPVQHAKGESLRSTIKRTASAWMSDRESLVAGYFVLADRIRPMLQPGDTVLVTEVGALGWALPEQIIEDSVGLTGFVTTEEIRREQFNAWLTRRDRLPDYVLVQDCFTSKMFNGQLPVTSQFNDLYASVLRIDDVPGDAGGKYRATLFRQTAMSADETARDIALLPLIPQERFKPPEVMIYYLADAGRVHPALFEHPTNQLTLDIEITRPKLAFGFGLRPEVHNFSDGVQFMITIESDGATEVVFDRAVRPRESENDRRWQHTTINLARYAGKSVRLTFATAPLETPTHDAAAWLSPRLVDEATP